MSNVEADKERRQPSNCHCNHVEVIICAGDKEDYSPCCSCQTNQRALSCTRCIFVFETPSQVERVDKSATSKKSTYYSTKEADWYFPRAPDGRLITVRQQPVNSI